MLTGSCLRVADFTLTNLSAAYVSTLREDLPVSSTLAKASLLHPSLKSNL